MNIIHKISKLIKNPGLILVRLDNINLIRLNDKLYLKIMYKSIFNEKLNLKNPKTFNEKLQWLKLYDKKDNYTRMVDKYEVKKYVADIIGSEYIIPTIGIYDSWKDIDFKSLPNEFVIKCTHYGGSKGVYIVKDKNVENFDKIKEEINEVLKDNLYYYGREWPYKSVKPRIIIEKYMIDKKIGELRDYKFFVFNGNVKFYKIDFNRFKNHKANYFDKKGNLLKFGEEVCPPDYDQKLELPKNIDLMINLAEKLANQIPFVRVDFYEIEDKVFFGELTFYPASGFGKFIPYEWDSKIGKLLDINGVGKNEK